MRKEGWPPMDRPDPRLQSTHRSTVSQPRGVSRACSPARIQAGPACWFIAAAPRSQLPRTHLGKLAMCRGRCKQLKSSAVENSWAPRAVLPGTGLPGQGAKSTAGSGRKVLLGSCHPLQKLEKGCFCTTEVHGREKRLELMEAKGWHLTSCLFLWFTYSGQFSGAPKARCQLYISGLSQDDDKVYLKLQGVSDVIHLWLLTGQLGIGLTYVTLYRK